MVRIFAPGSRCGIDYADGIDILDPVTGELFSPSGMLKNIRALNQSIG
jgi:hypothetical protein